MYKPCPGTMDDDEVDADFISESSPKIESPSREDSNAHPDKNEPKPGTSTDSQTYHITDLPPEIMQHILKFISFDNIAKIRLVCKHFDNLCSSLLNSEFNRLRSVIQQRLLSIKSQMPRRESARRKHALAREHDIIETLNMRLSLLHMTLGKHIERKYCCFFPGEIIDEVYRVLRYIENTPCLNHGYKVTDELFDLSTMAMEYFKEHIEPRLPEISYFAPDFLDYSMLSSTHETQLAIEETIARANSRSSSSTLTKDPLILLSRHFRKIKETVKKNGTDIMNAKHSLKVFKKKINSLEKEVQQIKWQQKDSEKVIPDVCKINEVLLEVNRHKVELELLKAEVSNQSCSCHSSQPHSSTEVNDCKDSVLPGKEKHGVKLEMADDKSKSSEEKSSHDEILLAEQTERKKTIKKEKKLSSGAQVKTDKGFKGSSTQVNDSLAELKSLKDVSEDLSLENKICSEKIVLRTPSKRKNIRNKLSCSSPVKSNGKRKLNSSAEFKAENDFSAKKKKLDFNVKTSSSVSFSLKCHK